MTVRCAITQAEFARLAEQAKQERVVVRYQRTENAPIVTIIPDIPADHRSDDVEDDDEGAL